MSTRPSWRDPNRVREHLPDEADELLKGRVQVINLWRPIRGPVRDTPLAMCDGTTVAAANLVASDLIYPNRRGETYSVKIQLQPSLVSISRHGAG